MCVSVYVVVFFFGAIHRIQCEQLLEMQNCLRIKYSEKQQPPPIRCDVRPIIDASIRVALRIRNASGHGFAHIPKIKFEVSCEMSTKGG